MRDVARGLPEGFDRFEVDGSAVAVHRAFSEASRARHGFALRTGARWPGGAETASAAGLDAGTRLALLRQVHGDRVVVRVHSGTSVDRATPGQGLADSEETGRRGAIPGRAGTVSGGEFADASATPEADGHLTADPTVALAIQSADCVPVLVADPRLGLVGVAHAGWKGTSLEISGVLVRQMNAAGSRAEDLVALLGPAIGPCCYEVGEEVISVFRARFPEGAEFLAPGARAGHAQIDLAAANAATLRSAGIPAARIYRTGLCTACRTDLFPSWRREGPGCGRMWSVIAA